MLSLVILPLLLVVVMPFLIPFLAWKGRPPRIKAPSVGSE